MGVFVEESINETLSGAVPEVGVPLKPATGPRADTGKIVSESRTRKNKDVHNTLRCTCTEFIKKTNSNSSQVYSYRIIRIHNKKCFYFNFRFLLHTVNYGRNSQKQGQSGTIHNNYSHTGMRSMVNMAKFDCTWCGTLQLLHAINVGPDSQ